MSERDRLIELLRAEMPTECDNYESCQGCPYAPDPDGCYQSLAAATADHLLANGVILPPVKAGDTVYEIEYEVGSYELWEAHPLQTEVTAICILTEYDYHPLCRFGKDVFLTREEAEQASKEVK